MTFLDSKEHHLRQLLQALLYLVHPCSFPHKRKGIPTDVYTLGVQVPVGAGMTDRGLQTTSPEQRVPNPDLIKL
jgi:hypothetical protein